MNAPDPSSSPDAVAAITDAFVAALSARSEVVTVPRFELEGLLVDLVMRGVDAHREFGLVPAALATYLGERLPTQRPTIDTLFSTRIEDLALAMACAQQLPAALRAFDQTFADELTRVLGKIVRIQNRAEELLQTFRQKLFVSSPPKIAEYAGQGDLRHWLRVAALRIAIDASRKRQTSEESHEASTFERLAHAEPDAEMAYFKKHYAARYQQAFESTAATLGPDERNLLRQHYAHGLTVDQIAALHGIHRATAARRVAKARDSLLLGTRRLLMTELQLSRDGLDSVMRLIESRMTLSVSRVLGGGDESEP